MPVSAQSAMTASELMIGLAAVGWASNAQASEPGMQVSQVRAVCAVSEVWCSQMDLFLVGRSCIGSRVRCRPHCDGGRSRSQAEDRRGWWVAFAGHLATIAG